MIRCPKKRRFDGLEGFIPVVANVGFGTQWRFAAEGDAGALPDRTARWDNKRRAALHNTIAAVGHDDSASDIGSQIRGEEDCRSNDVLRLASAVTDVGYARSGTRGVSVDGVIGAR
jgi:hypothetical protein